VGFSLLRAHGFSAVQIYVHERLRQAL